MQFMQVSNSKDINIFQVLYKKMNNQISIIKFAISNENIF